MNIFQKINTKTILIIAVVIGLIILGKIVGDDKKSETKTTEVAIDQSEKNKEQAIKNAKEFAEVNLRLYIQQKLMNPKSFDVLSQKSYKAGDSTIVVAIEYTATNAFGGTIKDNIQAEADLNGKLTKIFGGKALK